MTAEEWKTQEKQERRQNQMANWFTGILLAGSLAASAPILVDHWRVIVLVVCSVLGGVCLIVSVCYAIAEICTTEPLPGVEVRVAHVSRMDLKEGEDLEQWERTSKYVTREGDVLQSEYIEALERDELRGVEFGVVSEQKRKQKLQEIAEEVKLRREKGVELEVKK